LLWFPKGSWKWLEQEFVLEKVECLPDEQAGNKVAIFIELASEHNSDFHGDKLEKVKGSFHFKGGFKELKNRKPVGHFACGTKCKEKLQKS